MFSLTFDYVLVVADKVQIRHPCSVLRSTMAHWGWECRFSSHLRMINYINESWPPRCNGSASKLGDLQHYPESGRNTTGRSEPDRLRTLNGAIAEL